MPPKDPKVPAATTPEDNDYCPQGGNYDRAYSGDLTERTNEEEFETRDEKVDATREEFAHQDKPSKPEAWD
jgi:hypothetical protein